MDTRSNIEKYKVLVLFVPFLYTIFNKYGIVEGTRELWKCFWDYYVWKTLIYEFGGPYLFYIIFVIRDAGFDIGRIIAYGIWIFLSLYIYEIGYILNDFLAYWEPEDIRNSRLSKLYLHANHANINKIVWKVLFERFTIIFMFNANCIIHEATIYCFATALYVLIIIPLFILHSSIYSRFIRGFITEFALRSLRVMSTIFLYPDNILSRHLLLLYSISNGVLASYGYFETKNLAKIKLTRNIELLVKCLIMMLGIFIFIGDAPRYIAGVAIFLLPSFIATSIRYLGFKLWKKHQ